MAEAGAHPKATMLSNISSQSGFAMTSEGAMLVFRIMAEGRSLTWCCLPISRSARKREKHSFSWPCTGSQHKPVCWADMGVCGFQANYSFLLVKGKPK